MENNIYQNGLFIFRRDLRIIDNNGLNYLSEHCKNIYAIFIFTPEQVGKENKYKSDNSVQFMIESLENLSDEIKNKGGRLYTFYGDNEKIIHNCIKSFDINLVVFNLDITPYAIKRDNEIIKLCKKNNIHSHYGNDYYLHTPGTITTGNGNPYQKFTPYYITASKIKVDPPSRAKHIPFKTSNINIPNKISLDEAMNKFTNINEDILVHGGRNEALKQLIKASKTQSNYTKTHNDLDKQTTQLSAYIKFGCISIREVYKTLKSKKDIIRQLYWRDFYANILHEFPHVLGHSMKPNYDKIKWNHNYNFFDKWCKGNTGFPIVDAGMRQLNTTGYMHNRARLVVASFLIKILLIDWRKGEKYFATKLTDYDPASNNLNWQWCASSAVDSQPYFRIFNPWLQTESYDHDCKYIKIWIPELKDVPNKDILKWDTMYSEYKNIHYPKPIVDYQEQKEKALKIYKSIY
jgi:deoxyribodipyrimidine photo-lyase